MDIVNSNDSVDVLKFQFKLHRHIRAFSSSSKTPINSFNQVAAASRFGLLFVGTPDKQFLVFKIKDLIENSSEICPRRKIALPAPPEHLTVNCTKDFLSVVIHKNDSLITLLYSIPSFATENPIILQEIRMSASPNVTLGSLLWSPCQPDLFASCTSDGALSIFQCKQNSLQAQTTPANARCISWSPKGKLVVTGNADGSLTQYKPDLTLVKTIPAPPIFGNNGTKAIAINWISNFQYSVVYSDIADPEKRPSVTIVNTPKAGTPVCINYDDICFSGGCRHTQYNLTHLPLWGVMLAISANSMEVGVLGSPDKANWQNWMLTDEARAELPLTDKKQENYPIGVAYDDAAIHQLPWGENELLPHMPMIHILSHTGTLVSFFAINLFENSPNLCSPPELLNIPPHLMNTNIDMPPDVRQEIQPAPLPVATASFPLQDLSFVISQNTATSTPTVPKPTSPFAVSGYIGKPIVSNLFGAPKEQSPLNLNAAPVEDKKTVTKLLPASLPTEATLAPKTFGAPIITKEVQPIDIKQTEVPLQSTTVPDPDETEKNVPTPKVMKAMLLKEVNDFQIDLYDLLKRCQAINTQIGTGNEMKSIATVLAQADHEPIDKFWSEKEIKHQVMMLKHNLLKTYAILAEARMQPEMLELEQLEQLDPVTADQMTTIKRSLYYIETQLKQINNSLDEQWETFQDDCKKRVNALRDLGDGGMMKMPTMDKVYQPLVKQHDILTRQQCMVKALRKTMESLKPQIYNNKTGRPLLSAKAFSNSESLSTLTKNLLNLSLQPADLLDARYKAISERKAKFTAKKQNALREVLFNHKTVRIKSVTVETPAKHPSYYDWDPSNYLMETKPETPQVAVTPTAVSNITLEDNVNVEIPKPIAKPPVVTVVSKQLPIQVMSNVPVNMGMFVTNSNQSVEPVKKPEASSTFTFGKSTAILEALKGKSSLTIVQANQAKAASVQESSKPEMKPIAPPPVFSFTTIVPQNPTSVAPPSSTLAPSSVSKINDNNTFMGQNICSPIGKPTGSIFGSSTLPNQSTATPMSTSIFGGNNTNWSFTPKTTTSEHFISKTLTSTESKESSVTMTVQETFKAPSGQIFSGTTFTTVPAPTIPKQDQSSFKPKTEETTPKPIVQVKPEESFNFGSLSVTKTEKLTPAVAVTLIAQPNPGKSIFSSAKLSTTVTNEKPATAPIDSTPNASETTIKASGDSAALISLPEEPVVTLVKPEIPLNGTPPVSSAPPPYVAETKPASASIFGGTPASSEVSSIFNKTVSTFSFPAAATTSVFAAPVTTVTFGSPPSTTFTPATATTTPVPTTAVFNNPSAPTSVFTSPSAATSIFGTPPATTATFGSPSIFSGNNSATPVTSSVFSSVPQTSPAASNLFATANANLPFSTTISSPGTGQPGIFGFPAVTATTCAPSLFGAANAAIPSTVTSLFGSTGISTTSASTFGNSNNSGGSIFGSMSTFGGQPAFGQTGASVFGGGATSAFGQPQTNSVFGSAPAFGGFGGANTASSNVFGQTPSQPSNVFGAATTSPVQNSIFGGSSNNPVKSSIFGSPAASSPNPLQPASSIFGSPSSPGVFSGSPTFSTFGQQSFGSPPAGTGSFGGSFSAGGDQQNAFGSPSAFSKPNATFGGSPSFGSPAAFGGAPAFGGSPTFSLPGKVFGSSPGADTGFTSGNQQSSIFESLANQNTVTFGNIAEQSQQIPVRPAFQSSPSFSMWR